MPVIEDSDRRCPFDGKRMLVEIGQDDAGDSPTGWTTMLHYCLHCTYREHDRQWRRPRLTVVGAPTAAERLKELRLGRVVPMHIDTAPFPAGELDAS